MYLWICHLDIPTTTWWWLIIEKNLANGSKGKRDINLAGLCPCFLRRIWGGFGGHVPLCVPLSPEVQGLGEHVLPVPHDLRPWLGNIWIFTYFVTIAEAINWGPGRPIPPRYNRQWVGLLVWVAAFGIAWLTSSSVICCTYTDFDDRASEPIWW